MMNQVVIISRLKQIRYELIQELDSQLLQESEQLVQMVEQHLSTKTLEKFTKNIPSEWQFWLAVREKYHRITITEDKHMHRMIFPSFEQVLSKYAIYRWALHEEKSLAAIIFSWLLLEAESLGYWHSAKIYAYNLVVGFLKVPSGLKQASLGKTKNPARH